MKIDSIGIIGYGHFGKLIHTLVKKSAPSVSVRVYSSRSEPDHEMFFSLEEACATDAIVVCVPISAFESSIQKIVPLLRSDTVIVDVATVKTHTVDILRKESAGHRWIATHPMFGPESYKKTGNDVTGYRVVITDHSLESEHYEALASFLSSLGFVVVSMSPEEHDKHLAQTLFLTHYIGQVVTRCGFDRTPIDTVSFGFLMDAVESVRHDEALFRDVFTYNPYCKEVLQEFGAGERQVQAFLHELP